jgi:hypothetical protein
MDAYLLPISWNGNLAELTNKNPPTQAPELGRKETELDIYKNKPPKWEALEMSYPPDNISYISSKETRIHSR